MSAFIKLKGTQRFALFWAFSQQNCRIQWMVESVFIFEFTKFGFFETNKAQTDSSLSIQSNKHLTETPSLEKN